MKSENTSFLNLPTINNIDTTRFTNGAHGRFATETLAAFDGNAVINKEMPTLLGEYKAVVGREEDVLVPYKGSPLTKPLDEADGKMMAAWRHFKAGLRYYAGCEDADKKEAAEFMRKWAKDFEVDRIAQIDRQVGLLQNFVFDCEGKLQGYIRTLGMGAELAELRAQMEEVNRLLTERDKDNATFETRRVKAARKATDDVWHAFTTAVNGWIYSKGDDGLAEMVGFLNAYILREKREAFRQPTKGPEAEPEVPELGGGTTPDDGETEGEGGSGGGTTPENPGGSTGGSGNTPKMITVTYEFHNGTKVQREYPYGTVIRPGDGQYPANTPGYTWSGFYHELTRDWTFTEYDENDMDI